MIRYLFILSFVSLLSLPTICQGGNDYELVDYNLSSTKYRYWFSVFQPETKEFLGGDQLDKETLLAYLDEFVDEILSRPDLLEEGAYNAALPYDYEPQSCHLENVYIEEERSGRPVPNLNSLELIFVCEFSDSVEFEYAPSGLMKFQGQFGIPLTFKDIQNGDAKLIEIFYEEI